MLTCIVECSPLCSISWFRNQSLITNSTVFKVTDIARHVYITVHSTVQHSQQYKVPENPDIDSCQTFVQFVL